jgi:UDP-N-acetylmuramoyl-L-alanyl-D-glutamate--2,6-diaminopimelate ligase
MGQLVQTGLRKRIKKLFPKRLLRLALLPTWHLSRAIIANVRYGFPARGMTVIGITGTVGKSSSTALLASIFQAAGYKVGAFSTLEFIIGGEREVNKIGTTSSNVFTIQKFYQRLRQAKVDIVIQETTSHALDQHRVLGIPYQAALWTNLSYEHMDYHKNMEEYAAAKAKLVGRKLKFKVLNRDNEWFDYYNKFTATEKKLSFGQSPEADAHIENLQETIDGSSFTLNIQGHKIPLTTRLLGVGNVENVAGTATMAYLYGVPDEAIQNGIKAVENMPGRMQRVEAGQDFAVFSDVSHTPDGLQLIFNELKKLTKGRIILVQSTMDGRDPHKRVLLGEVAGKNADVIYVCDDEAFELPRHVMRGWIKEGIANAKSKATVHEIEDRQEAITAAMAEAKPGDTVLVIPFGHHDTMTFYGTTQPWNEVDAIRNSLEYVMGKTKTPPPKSWDHSHDSVED